MKHAPAFVALLLVAASLAPLVQADMYTVSRQGANIVPERSEDISMDAEDVRIERDDDGSTATVTFVMRNQSDRLINSLVAFPVIGSTYARERDLNRDFQVDVKNGGEADAAFTRVKAEFKAGRERTVSDSQLALNPPKIIGDYPELVVWNVSWEPQQVKVIRVRFNMGEPTFLPGSNFLAQGWQWGYIVTTGSLWKGPIGRADISIRVAHPAASRASLPPFRQVSYPDHAKWLRDDLVTWHFENWTPTEEIWIRSAEWRGLPLEEVPDYRFFLPADYRGAREMYSDTTIEDLVTRDLKLAVVYLPAEAQAFDRNLLRIAIADWLLHEIYARHGDSFFLGKETSSFPQQAHMVGDGEGNLYSMWNNLFTGYGYRNGWYRPNDPPAGAVKTSTLHPVERKNVAFLRAYLDRLRGDPKYHALRDSAHTPGID